MATLYGCIYGHLTAEYFFFSRRKIQFVILFAKYIFIT